MEPCKTHNCLVVSLNGQEICPLCWIEETYDDSKVRDLITLSESEAEAILFENMPSWLQLPIQNGTIFIESDEQCRSIISTEELLQAIDKKAIQNLTYYDEHPDDDGLGLSFPFIRIEFGAPGGGNVVSVDVEPQDIFLLACDGYLS
jgi:hypothetical protein